jgi:hypothetical protein
MATTTNYGWTTPDNTAYVKDGASAIRTLGSSVDTTLNSVTTGKNVGLVHLTTVTGTNQTFLEAQSVFTSTYSNYRVEFWGTASSAGNLGLSLQLMNGATVISTNYEYGQFFINSAGASGTFGFGVAQSSWLFAQYGQSGTNTSASIDIFNPFQARMTSFNGISQNLYGTSNSATILTGAYQTASTAYNGIRINGAPSNLTGELRIYGYRNS